MSHLLSFIRVWFGVLLPISIVVESDQFFAFFCKMAVSFWFSHFSVCHGYFFPGKKLIGYEGGVIPGREGLVLEDSRGKGSFFLFLSSHLAFQSRVGGRPRLSCLDPWAMAQPWPGVHVTNLGPSACIPKSKLRVFFTWWVLHSARNTGPMPSHIVQPLPTAIWCMQYEPLFPVTVREGNVDAHEML